MNKDEVRSSSNSEDKEGNRRKEFEGGKNIPFRSSYSSERRRKMDVLHGDSIEMLKDFTMTNLGVKALFEENHAFPLLLYWFIELVATFMLQIEKFAMSAYNKHDLITGEVQKDRLDTRSRDASEIQSHFRPEFSGALPWEWRGVVEWQEVESVGHRYELKRNSDDRGSELRWEMFECLFVERNNKGRVDEKME
ncbi:hypothetical protein SCHPADRAFT_929437 [Schizopora paradoxa]|uniref:Uncharacterized protein n=1 Tax=Schizopora paradoxa TaxID=27342 RepID=A0A0H2RKI0_9AGAM|nr:hypothetical protein SCHPADRAFT_929437 [Schizopora paradoxa]